MKSENVLAGAAAVAAAGLLLWSGIHYVRVPKADSQVLEQAAAVLEEVPLPAGDSPFASQQQRYPKGKLVLTSERELYDGGLYLEVPKLGYQGEVLAAPVGLELLSQGAAGVPDQLLESGVGLFGLSQLPGRYNSNVCIAGHRDIYGMEFYHIDQMEPGDSIYLTWMGLRYQYLCEEIIVTDPDDWSPIQVRDYSAVTLQSCTPVGVASHRIFAVGRLVEEEEPQTDGAAGAGKLVAEASHRQGEPLTLTVTNQSGILYTVGTGYIVQYWNGEEWVDWLHVKDDENIVLDLPVANQRIFSLPLYQEQKEYPAGQYRLLKAGSAADGEEIQLQAKFRL